MKNTAVFIGSAICVLTLIACGHAWVINQRPEGGVIAVEGNITSDTLPVNVQKLIPCNDYQITSRESKSSGDENPVQAYHAIHSDEQLEFPKTQASLKQWTEITYSCNTSGRTPASAGDGDSYPPIRRMYHEPYISKRPNAL